MRFCGKNSLEKIKELFNLKKIIIGKFLTDDKIINEPIRIKNFDQEKLLRDYKELFNRRLF